MPKIIKIIFFTIFLDLLGFGILIPVMPLLFASPDSAFYLLPAGYSVNAGLIMLGLLIAVFPIGQFFATPILGQLSDRYGRKKVLILSISGTAISYILFAIGIVTKNIPLLFISRFFDGITGGNISVAQATIADVTTPENRARNFGMLGAAFGLGFVFGPFIGGKLSDPSLVSWFNAATPFYFAAILATFNVFSIYKFLPETNKNLTNEKITFNKSISNIFGAFTNPNLKGLFTTSFFFTAGFSFFTTFFSVFLITRFGFDQGSIGNFFAYVGMWSIFTQAVVTRYAAKKWKQEQILSISLIGCSFMLLAYFLPTIPWQVYLIPPFFSLCTGLTMANMSSLISSRADKTIQGQVLGINASVTALAQSVPAILSGFIAAILAPTTPIIVASIFVAISWLIFLQVKKPKITVAGI